MKNQTSKKVTSMSSACHGISGRQAVSRKTNQKVYASKVTKDDGPFYCPECLSEVIVRKCTDKDDHFAHKARQSPAQGPKSQELHTKCKDAICEVMKNAYPAGNWKTERPIGANVTKGTPRIVPDISGRIDNQPVAIEVQLSPYTINKIREKTKHYDKLGIAVMWVVPLYEPLGAENFRPRMYEKYLHSMYYGRIYYWLADSPESIIPVHFGVAERYIDQSSWFSADGEEMYAGGYFLAYKSVKKPEYHPNKTISILKDFIGYSREKFTPDNPQKHIPKCKIFKDRKSTWWDTDEQRHAKQLMKRNNVQALRDYSYEEE